MLDPAAARDVIVEAARRAGFHRVALVPIEAPRRHALYEQWIAGGAHGEMTYLAEPAHVDGRRDLRRVLSEARTLVVVALAYARATVPADRLRGKLARYAAGDDYHLVMKAKLAQVADELARAAGRAVVARPCVDTAPLHEREWAERGGLGFVAKNTMLIAPGLGSYVVLGELLVDVDATPTAPIDPPKPRCGSCRACLDACPTGAFTDAYVLDARRCISYLTIEQAGAIPRELRAPIGTWIFGCDVCQEVCPFNAADHAPADALHARDDDHAAPDLVALAFAPSNQLRQFVKRTALRRVGRAQLLRNVAVALGNSGDPRAHAALVHLLANAAPLVRAHAAWGLARLALLGAAPVDEARAALDVATRDPDDDVRAEAIAALTSLA